MEDVTTKNVNEDSSNAEKQPKKCFCARCFLPIDPKDRVDVDGQNFHRMCSTCCVCHKIPKTLKMFYGHVFCEDCFKAHVLNRFKGDSSKVHSNSWWMQWAPGVKAQGPESETQPQAKPEESPAEAKPAEKAAETKPAEGADSSRCTAAEEPHKKCICARCLQAVDEKNKVEIDGQSFHPECCKCYFCHCVPKDKVKIYYGQVFCEECFNRFIMSRNKDVPAENLRMCCEQWTNGQFADSMREFMNGKAENGGVPVICMMQGAHPPFCRCGCGFHQHQQQSDWFQGNEPRKCEQTVTSAFNGEEVWNLSYKYHSEASDLKIRSKESAIETTEAAAEKIEKLTKYLQGNDLEKCSKKWKNFVEFDKLSTGSEVEQCFPWINYQDPKIERDENCPKCLWQCGPINVKGACF